MVNMTRRRLFLKTLLGTVAAVVTMPTHLLAAGIETLLKPLAEWRRLLPRDAYRVLFEEATERAGSSLLNDEKRPGTFVCAGCYVPLFDASTKYESGTGWPSFYAPIADRLETKRDWKLVIPWRCVVVRPMVRGERELEQ